MKFMSPTGQSIRVVLDGSSITWVHTDWTDIPAKFKAAALGAGCICEDQVADMREAKELNKEELLRGVVMNLLKEADVDKFGQDGLPKVSVVNEMLDFKVSKQMISEIVMEIDNASTPDGEISS